MKAIKWIIIILIVLVPLIIYYGWLIVVVPKPDFIDLTIGSMVGLIFITHFINKSRSFDKWFDSKLK